MNILISNIGQLVTPVPSTSTLRAASSLDVRENTELLIRDGRIAGIGTADRQGHVDAQIDARGGVLLPGFVDPHTHFTSATEDGASALDPCDGVPEEVYHRLRRMLHSGVTTVEVKCASLAELNELASLVRLEDGQLPTIVATLFGGAPSTGTAHAERMSGLIGDAIPTVRRRHLAQFCDVECGEGAYSLEEGRTILRAARAAGLHLKLHANGDDIGAFGDVAAELEITAVGHLIDVGVSDTAKLRRVGVIPVLLPGEGLLRRCPYPNAARMLEAGLAVGLGTNAGGAAVAAGSMWLIIALAVGVLEMSLEQVIAAATLHNAHALELAAEVGTIAIGKRADLLILDVKDYRDLLGGLGEEPIRFVIRNGEVVH